VFLEAWERGERYDPERGGLLTWLLTIARSRAIDHLRRRVPEPRDPTSAVVLADRADVRPRSRRRPAYRWVP
jgi:RNA polymerase sigma-70 factor (ECF subfamily)